MKRTKQALLALALVAIIALTPVTAFGAQTTALTSPTSLAYDTWEEFLTSLREVTLTPQAMDYVLEDYDYLVAKILEVSPAQNIIYRRYGVNATDYFAMWRQVITDNAPMPSILSYLAPDRWGEMPTDDLYIAADYLFTVLDFMSMDLGGLGHLSVQWDLVGQVAFGLAHWAYHYFEITEEDWEFWVSLGHNREVLEPRILASDQFYRLHHEIFMQPAVLWFYDIQPAKFDLDVNLGDVIGFRDPDNVTVQSLEPGFLAYIGIASFTNNLILDSEVLFPFFEAIQDYQHLIIDLRGNTGGWTSYFPNNIVSMLIDAPLSFYTYELFVASDHTAGFFEHPYSMMGGDLYGIFPIEEFVQSRNMQYFAPEDMELLNYVMVWVVEYTPAANNIPFQGEIWLLVDGDSMSASEMAASLSMYTGFATVVGEPTAGVTAVLYTYAALPNTGILFRIDLGYTVDQHGRSIEEFGVIPHILTFEGMDAFETVVDIILTEQLLDVLADILFAPSASPQIAIPPPPPADAMLTPALDDRYVPLRIAAYANGFAVEWDGANNSVLVTSPEGDVRVVAISTGGTFNQNGTVFVTTEFANTLFARFEIESQIVGTWAWDEGPDFVYIFNEDGTGRRGIPTIEETFLWSKEGAQLNITLLGDLPPLVLRDERWAFTIADDVLTLESLQVDDMVFRYIRQ